MFIEGSKRAPQRHCLLIRKSQMYTDAQNQLFLCAELFLCCSFSSMVWEVAPKPLSPPLWTPECIRPHLLMKMKMRMKSHPLIVRASVASLRWEGLVESRSGSLNHPSELLSHFTRSKHSWCCILALSSCRPASSLPPAKCHQKDVGGNREQQKPTLLCANVL